MMLKRSFLWLACAALLSACHHDGFTLRSEEAVTICYTASEEEVVHTALALVERDIEAVFSVCPTLSTNDHEADIVVGTMGQSALIEPLGIDLSPLEGKKEAFLLTVTPDKRLISAASASRR